MGNHGTWFINIPGTKIINFNLLFLSKKYMVSVDIYTRSLGEFHCRYLYTVTVDIYTLSL